MSRDRADADELERFKVEINLTEFAASRGYKIDRKESSRASVVMRDLATRDKIVVARSEPDLHWTYFSVRDHRDNGTVIDFVKNRSRMSFGEIRKDLRSWLGVGRPVVNVDDYVPTLVSQTRDRAAVQRLFETATIVANVPYLNSRGIRPETLADLRFRGTFRQDARGNVLFPHVDNDGLSGFEAKNVQWTAFAAGGAKALWRSNVEPVDRRLVVTEGAIDSISFHQMQPDAETRYASLGGSVSEHQLSLLAEEIRRLPMHGVVIAAFDSDEGGEQLTSQVTRVAGQIAIERQVSPIGKDWNDALKAQQRDYIRSLASQR